jgi:hypothetical protein
MPALQRPAAMQPVQAQLVGRRFGSVSATSRTLISVGLNSTSLLTVNTSMMRRLPIFGGRASLGPDTLGVDTLALGQAKSDALGGTVGVPDVHVEEDRVDVVRVGGRALDPAQAVHHPLSDQLPDRHRRALAKIHDIPGNLANAADLQERIARSSGNDQFSYCARACFDYRERSPPPRGKPSDGRCQTASRRCQTLTRRFWQPIRQCGHGTLTKPHTPTSREGRHDWRCERSTRP